MKGVPVPHGGGTQGKSGCDCEPCKTKYREYKREQHRKRTGSTGAHEVDHGKGVAGKRNCPCELCRQAKRNYDREHRRRTRAQRKREQA